MAMYLMLLWALVGLIGQVHCKCSLAPILDDDRSIAYACIHGDLNDLREIPSDTEWIEFSVARFQYIPDNAFDRFQNLRRLSFYNCHVNVISNNAFAGLNHLEWLIFHGSKIHVARSAWFRHLPNLRRLIMDRCGLIHIEPELFRMLPRLETLGLRDNDLDCLPVEELSYLRMLKTVRIDGNPWLCECKQKLERFLRDRNIIQEVECAREAAVCLNFQCMTEIGIPALPQVKNPQHLRIGSGQTTTHGSEFQTTVLSSLDRLPDKTTWIQISGLRMEKLPRYTFFRFGNSLRDLDLNNCFITNIENGAFAGLHKLQRLSLTGNRLSIVGSDWFRDLLALQQLILRGNEIEQIERTALWHLGESLRHLDIRNNRLRCLAIEELAELKKLEIVKVIGNPWTCSCRRNLQSFLTDRNIAFEINAGACYENENDIPENADRWRQQQVIETTEIGKVHWSSFEESIKELNMTIRRPSPPPPVIHVSQTPPTQSYQGICSPDKNDNSARIYTCTGITSMEEINVVRSTTHTIRILLSNIKRIPSNSFTRFDGYLSRLELRDCGIERIDHQAFSGLYNLEYLSLHSNQLESITYDTIQGLKNLRYLDLSRNHIYRMTNDVFDHLPYLTGLDISGNLMNCIGVEHMAKRLRYLTILNVADNPWSCLCATKLADFLESRRINYDKSTLVDRNEECYVYRRPSTVSTTFTTPGTTISATMPTISVINETVEGTCMSYDETSGVRYRCTSSNILILNKIPDDVVAIEFHEGHLPNLPAGAFSRFTNLQELIIRNSGVRVIEQGAFDGLDKLRNLTIQDNPIDTIGPSWFNLRNLDRLDLRGNSIRYIAPGAFQHLNQLTYLNLEGNDLKCIFTSDLNDMPNVHIIEFSGNPLKWRCRVELEQFLEMRKIRFIKIENSCEGKKLVRNLLYENVTEAISDCSSECSAATNVNNGLLIFASFLPISLLSIL